MDRQGSKLIIRPMEVADIDRVLQLEKEIFPDPWPRTAFVEQLSGPYWGAFVGEEDATVIGYACYMIVADESHLTNIAIAPGYRRKSVAKLLLDRILQVVRGHECTLLLLEVRPSNAEARAFYDKHGFAPLYRRPNYYRRPVEDAIVMVRYLVDVKDTK